MPYREDVQKSPRGVRPRYAMVAAVALIGEAAVADETFEWSADVAASSILIDRGEQIGVETLEFGAGIATSISGFKLYGSVYRLMPVGSDEDAFEDEVDYSVGVIFESGSVLADLSANWLTYPGEGTETSPELVGILDFDAPLAPRLIGFHDARFGDWGLEALVQPSWETGGWTHYALGRIGFVEPGDGSANRSYAGVELGSSRPISDHVELGFFARLDLADEHSYADEIDNGVIIHTHDQGRAVGLRLAVSG